MLREYRPTGISTTGTLVGDQSALSDNDFWNIADAGGDATYVQLGYQDTLSATFDQLPETSVTQLRVWFVSRTVEQPIHTPLLRATLSNSTGVQFTDTYLLDGDLGFRVNNSFAWSAADLDLVAAPLTLLLEDITPGSGTEYEVIEVILWVDGEIVEPEPEYPALIGAPGPDRRRFS